jgi:putative transcriptional regulator
MNMLTSPQTAKQIKELRYRLGMTQEQFAVELGVTVSAVNRWENGKSQPSPLALKAMELLENKANAIADA